MINSDKRYEMQEGDAIIFFRYVKGALVIGIGGNDNAVTTECAYECADMYMAYCQENPEYDLIYMNPEGEG
tara:strand:- start:4991 stop:5203 length:213 start_codon:yes stop_codon:yes gene_type:complete